MQYVLVADDDKLVQDLLRFRLERVGFGVTTVDSGETVMDLIQNSNPDLVILDFDLPVVKATDILGLLAQSNCDVPVIVLAAEWSEGSAVAALDLGAADYVTKPFSPDELVRRVRRLVK